MNPRHLLAALLLGLACLLPLAGQGAAAPQPPTVIQGLAGPQDISHAFRMLPDPQGVLDLEQVLSGRLDGQFQPVSNQVDFKVKVYWFQVVIQNSTSSALWGMGFTFCPKFTLYSRDGNGRTHQATNGWSIPPTQRLVPGTPTYVDLGLAPGETRTFYIRAESPLAALTVEIYPHNFMFSTYKFNDDTLLTFATVAIILVMVLYNLVIYGALRDKSYLYYAIFLLCLSLDFFSSEPRLGFHVGLSFTVINTIGFVASALESVFFLHFTRHFLMLRQRLPGWARVCSWVQVCFLPIPAAQLLATTQVWVDRWDHVFRLLMALSIILALVAATKAWRSGFRPARHYLQANLVFLTLYLIALTSEYTRLNLGLHFGRLMDLGIAIQVTLFSLVLGGRVRTLTQEKAQQEQTRLLELRRLTEEKNQELERKVLARTEELAQSNQKLLEAQKKLAGLMDSPQTLLEDIPAWATAMAMDLRNSMGLDLLAAYELQNDELLPLGPAPEHAPPHLSQVLEALKGDSRFGDRILLPARGLSGELRGVVLAATPRPELDSAEQQLLNGFASHLGSALEMAQVRKRLASSEARHLSTLEELHAQGIETLKVCPACGRCDSNSAETCQLDGTNLESPGVLPLRVMGRYRFTQRLGEGGMGTVYEAQDEQLDRAVAIKLMRPEFFHDVAARMRFEREIRTMAQVNHPNVVTVFDSGVLGDGSLFLVMELLRGLDLGSLVRQYGPGTPAQVARLLRQGAAALDAAHQRRIVHRDVKPQNIMLWQGPDGFQVKMLDFGLAKSPTQETKLTQTGFMLGTPAYMAPEQILCREANAGSDAFAFATVAYEALLGRPTVLGPSLPETIHAILYAAPTAPSMLATWIPKEVDLAFAQALDKDPAARPAQLITWANDLAGMLEPHPGGAQGWPDPLPARTKQTAQVHHSDRFTISVAPTAPMWAKGFPT